MSDPYDTASERVSVLGPTLRFKGELSAEEDLVIHGEVEGTIGPSPRVTVGAEAKVTASVHAATVIVEGRVEGDVKAEKAVVVKASADVRGNIESPTVNIVEGARFNGQVTMAPAESAPARKPSGRSERMAPKSETKDAAGVDAEPASSLTGTSDR
jgi:cytoskeletal protein CcmA (bactofilin family)